VKKEKHWPNSNMHHYFIYIQSLVTFQVCRWHHLPLMVYYCSKVVPSDRRHSPEAKVFYAICPAAYNWKGLCFA
jgi:hypothetical protein